MPYLTVKDLALKGIKPPVSQDQANAIAAQADAIGGDAAWPTAIKAFKKSHTVRNRKWVERKTMTKKETEAPGGEPEQVKEMYFIPPTITSFAQLRAQEEVEHITEGVRDLTYAYTEMLWNIINGMEQDKLAGVRTLSNEFAAELDKVLNQPMPESDTAKAGGGDPISEDGAVSLSESYGGITLQEGEAKDSATYVDVQIIRPGWGNARDNHYYPAEMLKRDSQVFAGAKMYETDHRDDEKSTRTWVSTIKEITGFTDEGAPIARVAVHDNGFAERLRNLNGAGLLEKMECSIMANGRARTGYEQGGRKGKVVEAITEVGSVDWVTKAGAGGKAMRLSETEKGADMSKIETTEPKPADEAVEEKQVTITEQEAEAADTPQGDAVTAMAAEDVKTILAASKLPKASQARLVREYQNQQQLSEAITTELEYVKEISGSGKPFGLSESESTSPKPVSLEELAKRKDEVNNRHFRR